MPVGTQATVKGLSAADLRRADAEIVLANTYHLRLRPGPERIAELGGLHRFMGWDGAILTDSGGYQVFSLQDRVALDENGATFRSHLDGQIVTLTPEEVVRIQRLLDCDIAMVLDHLVALPAPAAKVEDAAARTLRWAARSIEEHRKTVTSGQALFAIVQGALDLDARARQIEQLTALDFDGYALGGLSVGESKEDMVRVFAGALPRLPSDRIRYVMGIGHPEDILAAIEHGADLFDCVLPTRHARTAQAFTSRGIVRLRNRRHRESDEPLDPECSCETCTRVPVGYLSHLYHSDEMLGPILVTRHNVHFYQSLVHRAGAAIGEARFAAFRDGFLAGYRAGAGDGSEDEAT